VAVYKLVKFAISSPHAHQCNKCIEPVPQEIPCVTAYGWYLLTPYNPFPSQSCLLCNKKCPALIPCAVCRNAQCRMCFIWNKNCYLK